TVWPTAIAARFLPRRPAKRRYRAWKYESFFRLAAHDTWHKARRSHTFPFVVRLRLRLPADSSFPGQTPAHDDRWPAVGNCVISTPISATTFWIVWSFTPG